MVIYPMIIRPSPVKSLKEGAKLFLRISFIVPKLNAISKLNKFKEKLKVLRKNSSLSLEKNSNISLEMYSKSL
jgi:hypothetical protein